MLLLIILFSIISATSGLSSSVWCFGSHTDHRHCSFKNLCYSPYHAQWVFFHSPNSSLAGVEAPDEQRQLTRLSTVSTSAASAFMDYAALPSHSSADYDIETFSDHAVFILHRWNPDSALHVFHDDLVPLVYTLRHFCFGDAAQCLARYRLVFTDQGTSRLGPFYAFLSPNEPLLLADLKNTGEKNLLCFEQAVIGIDQDTLWYNHGLDDAQGPIPNINLKPHVLEEFRELYFNHIPRNSLPGEAVTSDVLLLHSKGLNSMSQLENLQEIGAWAQEEYLSHFKSKPKISQLMVDPTDPASVLSAIEAASSAKLLITPHGDLSIMALFLPAKAGYLELFPYALEPTVFSFGRTLSSKKKIIYSAWVNHAEANTRTYPNARPSQGGLRHLEPDLRKRLQELVPLPPTRYNDPAYLYRLYQTTKVDGPTFKDSFSNLCEDFLGKEREGWMLNEENDISAWLIPSKVTNFRCEIERHQREAHGRKHFIAVNFHWQPPINLPHISHESAVYELLVEFLPVDPNEGVQDARQFSTRESSLSLEEGLNLSQTAQLRVWISVLLDGHLRGVEVNEICDLDQDFPH